MLRITKSVVNRERFIHSCFGGLRNDLAGWLVFGPLLNIRDSERDCAALGDLRPPAFVAI
jgi:hypothetical protein